MSWLILPGDLIRITGKGRGRVLAVDRVNRRVLCLVYETVEIALVDISTLAPWREGEKEELTNGLESVF